MSSDISSIKPVLKEAGTVDLYLRVVKFNDSLWFLRKPFSANHVPLRSSMLASHTAQGTSISALPLFQS